MDIVNFDALKAQGKVLPANDVDLTEDYFIIGKRNVHYNTNSFKATEYPIYAIKAGDVMGANTKYKVYSGLLTQTGVAPPVVTVLENTLGPVTWGYYGVGNYTATSTALFTAGKTFVTIGSSLDAFARAIWNSTNVIKVDTLDLFITPLVTIDEQLFNTPFEIRVYN
jgi:hypothetical protein